MNKLINYFRTDKYIRNVSVIVGGTALAQIIQLSITPILTRLYSQSDFGYLGTLLSISAFLTIFITLRYELALFLPRNKELVDMFTGWLIFFVGLLALLYFGLFLLYLNFVDKIYSLHMAVLLLLLAVLAAYNQVLTNRINRAKLYEYLSVSKVLFSFSVGILQLLFFYTSIQEGLVWGTILGTLVVFAYVFYVCRKTLLISYNLKTKLVKKLLFKYKKFPLFDVPSAMLGIGASTLPNILFLYLFSPAAAGAYYLTQRVLQAPITFFSTSVLEIFKESAANEYRIFGHAKKSFLKTLKLLLILGIPSSIFLYFFIEELFLFVFGPQWDDAAHFAKMLIPALAVRFIANPLSFMFYIAQKQHLNLVGMLCLSFMMIVSFYLGTSASEVVRNISLSYFLIYSLYTFWSARIAGVF